MATLLLVSSCTSEPTSTRFQAAGIEVGDIRLDVWLAEESAQRRHGLSEIDELPETIDGMLFVFPVATSASFNMEDVFFPLDIWWFDAGMTLIGKTRMEPCTESPCTSYGAPGEIKWALETPADAYAFQPESILSIVENN